MNHCCVYFPVTHVSFLHHNKECFPAVSLPFARNSFFLHSCTRRLCLPVSVLVYGRCSSMSRHHYGNQAHNTPEHLTFNPLTPELNPSAQRCLTRFLLCILLLEPCISLIYVWKANKCNNYLFKIKMDWCTLLVSIHFNFENARSRLQNARSRLQNSTKLFIQFINYVW
jgi:hypothetical protein